MRLLPAEAARVDATRDGLPSEYSTTSERRRRGEFDRECKRSAESQPAAVAGGNHALSSSSVSRVTNSQPHSQTYSSGDDRTTRACTGLAPGRFHGAM